jgi:hypothetical protein
MQNFVPLGEVFRKVADLVDATAAHMNSVAVFASHQAGHEREAMLARTIAGQRRDLSISLREYCDVAPEPVKSTWLQYTPDTDRLQLLSEFREVYVVLEAVGALDRIDAAVCEIFAISERQQEIPAQAKEACAWAARCLDDQQRRRASALRTANDI